jgi:hypothetical protein
VTLVRRAAVAVSGFVVRHAAAGSREWAEGLEREVEYIESDWRALVWALGSARVLLDRRAGRAGEEAPARPPLWRTFPFIVSLLAVEDSWHMLCASNWHDRLAWCMIACGFTDWTVRTFAGALWDRKEPPVSDRPAYWAFRRASLLRELQNAGSARRIFRLLAILSMGTGYVMTLEGWGNSEHITAGFVITSTLFGIWIWSRETPASIQARFQLVDERIAKALQKPDLRNWKASALPLRSDHWGRKDGTTTL